MMFQEIFSCSILHLNWKEVQTLTKVVLIQDSVDQEIETEIKAFLAEEVEVAEVLSWWNLNKKTCLHLARFARRYFPALPSSVYSERILFSEAGNLYEQKQIDCFQKPAKNFYFFITT